MSKELDRIKADVDELETALMDLRYDASRIIDALSELNPKAEQVICRCAVCRMDMDIKKESIGDGNFKIMIQPCRCQKAHKTT